MHLSPIEFHYALEDKGQVFDFEYSKLKITCEAIRKSTFLLINAERPEKKQVKNPKKYMPFPWDEEKKMKAPTPDEMKMMAKWIQLATSSPDNKNKKRVRHFNGNSVRV